jgi:hypothetical protein
MDSQTLRAVATSLDISVAGGTVRAEGDLDFRGTLVKLTKRYCVVYQSLASPVPTSATATVQPG